jgi:hypothetical protein
MLSIRMKPAGPQRAKISLVPSGKSLASLRASRAHKEGRFAIVTSVGAGCDGRFGFTDE